MYDKIINNRPGKWLNNKEVLAWGSVALVALVLCVCAVLGYKEWRYMEDESRKAKAVEIKRMQWLEKERQGFTPGELEKATNVRVLYFANKKGG